MKYVLKIFFKFCKKSFLNCFIKKSENNSILIHIVLHFYGVFNAIPALFCTRLIPKREPANWILPEVQSFSELIFLIILNCPSYDFTFEWKFVSVYSDGNPGLRWDEMASNGSRRHGSATMKIRLTGTTISSLLSLAWVYYTFIMLLHV